MLILTFSTIVNSQTNVTLSMDDIQIPKDSENSYPLKISNVVNLGSFSLNLSWDPNVIDITDINSDNFTVIPYINQSKGYVYLTGYTFEGLNGSFNLLDIIIKAIGRVDSSCYLEISYCEFLTADPKPSTINCDYNENLTLITIKKAIPDDNNQTPDSNNAPYANISVSSKKDIVNKTITFDASKSYDSDGTIISYIWNFDDGKTASGIQVDHVFLNPGQYHVVLTVTDNDDTQDEDFVDIIITQINNISNRLQIIGPTYGAKSVKYEFFIFYSFINNTFNYSLDWGDNTTDFKNNFTVDNSVFKLDHIWTNLGRYPIKLSINDNNISETIQHIILIDSVDIYYNNTNIGFITDNNLDGIFDTFKNNKDLIRKISSGIYVIDKDGDGIWDYTYNADASSVGEYKEDRDTNNKTSNNSKFIIIIIGIVFIILIWIILLIFFKKRKNK